MEIHPFTMVVGVDLSEYADAVIEHGFDQALRHDEAIVHVVTVISDPAEEVKTRARLVAVMEEAVEDVVPADRRARLHLFAHVRAGRADEQIVELAEEAPASLVVVGRFGAHLRHGSIADRIVAGVGCPILVVPPPRDTTASDAQCRACVDARRFSKGEIWFCAAHHGDHLGTSTAAISAGAEPNPTLW